MSDNYESFKYINLSDIDPTDKPLPKDIYTLMVVKFVLEEYSPKNGPNAGQTKERISAQFAVTGDGQFAGRRLFHTFFLNPISLRELRQLADATGINISQPIDVVAQEFANVQPTFKVMVDCVQSTDWRNKGADGKAAPLFDAAGKPVMENRIIFRQAVPA